MKRKLVLVNVALLAALAWLGVKLRQDWMAGRERERTIVRQRIQPAPAPPMAQTPPQPALRAESYLDVAQNMLFAKDRNPNVVVEAQPPKPTPPFPRFYGLMNLGDGPLAILSEGAGRRQQGYMAGQKVGEFKIAAIGSEELVFEWDGKKLTKKFSDLAEKGEPQQAPEAGPGTSMGGGFAGCNPGDNSPAGTVVDGMKKVINETPFGKVCRWEPAK